MEPPTLLLGWVPFVVLFILSPNLSLQRSSVDAVLHEVGSESTCEGNISKVECSVG